MNDPFDDLARNQRALWEEQAAAARQEANRKLRATYFAVGMGIYASAELGPMYAALNPDPRVYEAARASADRVQAAAMVFIEKTLTVT